MEPAVFVFSNFNRLSFFVVKLLLQKGCRVWVISNKPAEWKANLQSNSNSLYITEFIKTGAVSPDYILVISKSYHDFLTKSEKEFIASCERAVKLFVLPAMLTGKPHFLENDQIKNKRIYVGDTFDLEKDVNENSTVIAKLLASLAADNVKLPPIDLSYLVAKAEDASEIIFRELFTYWFEKPLLVGKKVSLYGIAKVLKDKQPDLKIVEEKRGDWPLIRKEDTALIGTTIDWEMLDRLLLGLPKKKKRAIKLSAPSFRVPKRIKLSKTKVAIFLSGLIAFMLPYIFLFFAVVFAFISLNLTKQGNWQPADLFLRSTNLFAKGASFGFGKYVSFPYLKQFFLPTLDVSEILVKSSNLGLESLLLIEKSKDVIHSVVGNGNADSQAILEEFYLDIESVYHQTALVEARINSSRFLLALVGSRKETLHDVRLNLAYLRDLVKNAPQLLGAETPKTYLLIFQNNMEIRPTGGFIGSFALITFEAGKLIDKIVYDVYTADGQLKGYVKPPKAIVDYLNEAKWYLRDSNWDPDFVMSAKRAEWFLDKSIDRRVDGVIAVDLEAVKTLLQITGPVNLIEYGDTIDHRNLYEKVQHEVEADFFDGSRKKATYLSSLFDGVLSKLQKFADFNYLEALQSFYDLLSSRDIQIYLHDQRAFEVLSKLGWDGSVVTSECELANCFDSFGGLVEANLGVNKVNYYIKRNSNLSLFFESGLVRHVMEINLVNTASPGGNQIDSNYKAYLRIIAPNNTSFADVLVSGEALSQTISPEVLEKENYAEAGILVEIPAGESKIVRFEWTNETELDFSKSGVFNYLWRKQAGVPAYPVHASFEFPQGIRIISKQPPALTGNSFIGYNFSLQSDLNINLVWPITN